MKVREQTWRKRVEPLRGSKRFLETFPSLGPKGRSRNVLCYRRKDVKSSYGIKSMSEEAQYLRLIERILEHGSFETTRNGTTKCIFGERMRCSLRGGTLPLITSKKIAWKACFHELMWFVRGQVDNQILQAKGVHIWDGNSSRSFLDGRGRYAVFAYSFFFSSDKLE